MMRQYELVERVRRYKPNADETLLNKAYIYAMQKHGAQKRASGDPYFSHPLEVATILTDMHLDEATVAVALLHDTIEDTDATRTEIDKLFGTEIGALVEGLTKLKKLDLVSQKAIQAENLRKLLIAISKDVRVLLVKLADRLHNMRTLHVMREDKRRRIAQETMDIYAPLAGRMGMQDVREELEELAFRHINPQGFTAIMDKLTELSARNSDVLTVISRDLTELFAARGIKARIKSRQKKAWSIFSKMERQALSFEQLSDLYGFRVIVNKPEDCYRALGIIHTTWTMVPGRFKDYISMPKQNGYRSLHTTVVGPSRQRVELQIRTLAQDEIAEYGVAAHAVYKEKGSDISAKNIRSYKQDTEAYAWLRQTIQILSEGGTPEEFLENTKLELFQDQVFCFTPKGRLIALPRGATPIDFAYMIHSDIGDSCIGAKINGLSRPLTTRLTNGDEVEIICSSAQVPPAAWEELVVTGKARMAIRRATRAAVRKQYSGLGQRILERVFEKAGKSFVKENLEEFLPRLGRKDGDDVLASVGRGELSPNDVMRALYPDYQDKRATPKAAKAEQENGWFNIPNVSGMIFKVPQEPENAAADSGKAAGKNSGKKTPSPDKSGKAAAPHDNHDNIAGGKAASAAPINGHALPIRGINRAMPVCFAPEGAVPGDRIVGILQPGQGIVIYPIQSPRLSAFDDKPEWWLDVRWDIDAQMSARFPARIAIIAGNSPGSLAETANIIARNDANIQNLSLVRTAPDFSEMILDLEVWDLKHLNTILSQLRRLTIISQAYRVNG